MGTVASTIMYSFYLHVTSESNQFCTVPIININRANLGSHVELKWLLDSCHIDQSSLIFADEVSLTDCSKIYNLKRSSGLHPNRAANYLKPIHLSFLKGIEVDAVYESILWQNNEKNLD